MVSTVLRKTAIVDPDLLVGNLVEVLPNQLYFACLTEDIGDSVRNKTVFITFHGKFHYEPFYEDFGPWNLSVLYRLCIHIDGIVNSEQRRGRKVVMYCAETEGREIEKVRVNAAYVMAAYLIVYHGFTADSAYLVISAAEPPKYIGFRDAAMNDPTYLLHVHDVLRGVEKALHFGWLDFTDFDYLEYERYEKVENGDFNWIIPGKILSFCGPHRESRIQDGYPYHAPDVYFDYFQSHGVSTIVRLNMKVYEAKDFTDAGFDHVDLFFVDGSTPSDEIVEKFIKVVDTARGGVAVHCKAGLGRTGTLIACWMMKEYGLTAAECMAWLRVCRPGSVIGPQQKFLTQKQRFCWALSKTNGVHMSHKPSRSSSDRKSVIKLVNKVFQRQPAASFQNQPVQNANSSVGNSTLPPSASTRSSENSRPRPNILSVRRTERRQPPDATPTTRRIRDETELDEQGRSQGDRLLVLKARSQHRSSHDESTPERSFAYRSSNSAASFAVPSQAFLNKNREPITPQRTKIRSATNTPCNNNNLPQYSYRTRGVGSAATAAANAKTPSAAVFPSIASRRSDPARFSSPTTPIKAMSPPAASVQSPLTRFGGTRQDAHSAPISRCTVSTARSETVRNVLTPVGKTSLRKIQLGRPRPYPPQGVRIELAANGNAYDLRPRVIREPAMSPGSELAANTDALLGVRLSKFCRKG